MVKTVKQFKERKEFNECYFYGNINEELGIDWNENIDENFNFNNDEYGDYWFNAKIIKDEKGLIDYIDVDYFTKNPVYIEEYNYRFYSVNNEKWKKIQ